MEHNSVPVADSADKGQEHVAASFDSYYKDVYGEILPRFKEIGLGFSGEWFDGKPVHIYKCVDRKYKMQKVDNEVKSVYTRQTANGKTLTYELEVLQQPERARACGMGPKSQSDRRPIDPPPVVMLRIHDGEKDITHAHDASFMLFASLEMGRPIAGGVMHSYNHMPVLTGSTAAGAAYLQRPHNAAYFIFPDISVRHEGWYRLRFQLFEQTKNPENADPEDGAWRPVGNPADEDSTEANPLPSNSQEQMKLRMYVRSEPFQVFSAKKFPGLIKSTQLSIDIAQQGCRVRIRREIRQRRGDKGGKKGDDSSAAPTPLRANSTIDRFESHHRHATMDSAISPRTQVLTAPQSMCTSPANYGPALSVDPSVGHPNAITPQMGTAMMRPSLSHKHSYSAYDFISTSGLPSINNLLAAAAQPRASLQPSPAPSYDPPSLAGQKRGLNISYGSSPFTLKDHARPPSPHIRRAGHFDTILNGGRGQPLPLMGGEQIIEASEEDDDSDSTDDLLENMYQYKRANGDTTLVPRPVY